jgi:hypothetical protein
MVTLKQVSFSRGRGVRGILYLTSNPSENSDDSNYFIICRKPSYNLKGACRWRCTCVARESEITVYKRLSFSKEEKRRKLRTKWKHLKYRLQPKISKFKLPARETRDFYTPSYLWLQHFLQIFNFCILEYGNWDLQCHPDLNWTENITAVCKDLAKGVQRIHGNHM